MDKYVPQIKINSYDPLCSASSLEGTVIGILFDKTGLDIKNAIKSRLGHISNKIVSYEDIYNKINKFIEEKRAILKELDHIYQERNDEKNAKLLPFKREIEEIERKVKDLIYDFNMVSYKLLNDKAVIFEKGFDDFKVTFKELDGFMEKEKDIIDEIRGISGSMGIQGATGLQGLPSLSNLNNSCSNTPLRLNSEGSPSTLNYSFTEDDDKAASKIGTLRDLLKKYMSKLVQIEEGIKKLTEEKRRLDLIYRNINDTRTYKLDINKLSAFGFEDIIQD